MLHHRSVVALTAGRFFAPSLRPVAAALAIALAPHALAVDYVGPGGVIPDAPQLEGGPPGVFVSEVQVTDAILVSSISVSVNKIVHSWAGDVILQLTHVPTGASQTLVYRIGLPANPPPLTFGDSSNYEGTYSFVDGANNDIWSAAAQGGTLFAIPSAAYHPSSVGSGAPVSLLAVFGGIAAPGTWRLTVSDAAAGDAGEFASWTLSIGGGGIPVCPGAGSCFTAHGTPGCDAAACCTTVCVSDPTCCEQAWDAGCVDLAFSLCAGCGSPASGDCCAPHAGPGCSNAECCESVCGADLSCCVTGWDAGCAELASELAVCACPTCPAPGSCFAAHANPGCDDAACCVAVCAVDPFCCQELWDAGCADAALTVCGNCGVPTAGDCCTAHVGAGCDSAACCELVCAVDLSCCVVGWDLSCVEQAALTPECDCNAVCPGSDCCFTSHATPGCKYPECCEAVCLVDPNCCIVGWDIACAQSAILKCCPSDLNGDRLVDGADLGLLLETLYSPVGGNGPADFDCSGAVDSGDLGTLLSSWGSCS